MTDGAAEGPPLLQVAEGVATIRLRRPAQRNSLHDEDLHALLAMCRTLDADPAVRLVVLAADTAAQKRPVFCAGYHVGGFDSGRHDPRLFEQVPEALEALRPLTLCALSGSVYGGATDLVLACDLRLARAGSEWRMPAAALGLHYYPGGLRRAVSRLGLNLAKRAFLGAESLPVEALGDLFEQVLPAEAFEAALDARVRQLRALAPLAVQGMKRSLGEIADGRFDEAALRAREDQTLASADFAEGRAAFAARREARFQGR